MDSMRKEGILMKNPRRLVAHYKASNFSNKIVISFSRFNEDNDYCYEEVYDTNGNLICQKNKAGEVNFRYKYDEDGNLICTDDTEEQIWYDTRGNITHTLNRAGGDEVIYKYDENNNITYKREVYKQETFFSYDKNGKLIRKIVRRDKDGKVIERQLNDLKEYFKYDCDGKLLKYYNSNGKYLSYEYSEGKLISVKNKYEELYTKNK